MIVSIQSDSKPRFPTPGNYQVSQYSKPLGYCMTPDLALSFHETFIPRLGLYT